MEVSGKGFDVQPQAQTDMNSLWDSLQDRRTANTGIRKTQSSLRDYIFLLQNRDRG